MDRSIRRFFLFLIGKMWKTEFRDGETGKLILAAGPRIWTKADQRAANLYLLTPIVGTETAKPNSVAAAAKLHQATLINAHSISNSRFWPNIFSISK